VNAEFLLSFVIRPTLPVFLPERMTSAPAVAMLLAIALQESGLRHRVQQGSRGPLPHLARGWWEFERGGGVLGVLQHSATSELARKAALRLGYQPSANDVHQAIADNDALACVFARLLLWTLPQRLPGPAERDMAYRQYLDAWRPGKPGPNRWQGSYLIAWETVDAL
jgi:hypothetical protein